MKIKRIVDLFKLIFHIKKRIKPHNIKDVELIANGYVGASDMMCITHKYIKNKK